MNRFLKNIVLYSLPVWLLVVFIWSRGTDEEQRWNRIEGNCTKAPCIYQKLTSSQRNIDVAFLGTSRTMAAVFDSTLSKSWQCNVANLGYCRPGRNVQYELLKMLFENHHPKTVFIQISQDEDWYGHFDYGNVASTGDVFSSIKSKNPKYLRDLKNNFVMKFDLFQRNQLFNRPYSEQTCEWGYWPAGEKQDNPSPISFADTNSFNQRYTSIYFLQKMIDLCAENNCEIIFHCLPTFGLSGENPHYAQYYIQRGHVILDPIIFKDQKFWVDESHLTPEAAALYTEFLANTFSRGQLMLE